MKKIKFKVYLSIGPPSANHEDELEIEVPDNATEEEIEIEKDQATEEWGHNYIDLSHS